MRDQFSGIICSYSCTSKSSISSIFSISYSIEGSRPLKNCSIFFLLFSIHSISYPSLFDYSSRASSFNSSSSYASVSPKYSSSITLRICADVFSGAVGTYRLYTSFTPGRSFAAPKYRYPPKPGI